MNIALVLVTFNRCQLLQEMLDSVQQLSIRPNHVYVVDNNSSDDTQTMVSKFIETHRPSLSISYHNTGANLGGAGGFEYGSRLAYENKHDWIWLADDDVIFEHDCLEELMKHHDKGAILQPMRMNTDGSCAEISGIDYEINNILRLNPKQNTIVDIFHKKWDRHELKTIPFEGPCIKREVFEKIGFPNPKFFIFYDDLDFAIRANRAGFKIQCIKSAKMVRKIPFIQSRALGSWKGYFMYRNFFKVQILYSKKPIGLIRCILIYILVACYSIMKGQFKSINALNCALRDAFSTDFQLDNRFKP